MKNKITKEQIMAYAEDKGWKTKIFGNELKIVSGCPFCEVDNELKQSDHFFINIGNEKAGVWICHKCGGKGNFNQLVEKLDDKDWLGNQSESKKLLAPKQSCPEQNANKYFLLRYPELVDKCHLQLPKEIRNWLVNKRGWSNELIDKWKVGWDKDAKKKKEEMIIPIFNKNGELVNAKHFEPGSKTKKNASGGHNSLFEVETLKELKEEVVICEGELDRGVLVTQGFPAVCSTCGASSFFKKEWLPDIEHIKNIYAVADNDDSGGKAIEKIRQIIPRVKIIELPIEVGEGGDVTDYFIKLGKTKEDFRKLMQEATTERQTKQNSKMDGESSSNQTKMLYQEFVNQNTTELIKAVGDKGLRWAHLLTKQ